MNTLDWKNATPEQVNLWRYASTLIAYTTITPLYFSGAAAGSEFLTYNAGKLYIALSMHVNSANAQAVTSTGLLSLYNMADAVSVQYWNNYPVWDATAAGMKYVVEYVDIVNIFFSRVVMSIFTQIKFNGYRLNV